MARGFLAGIVSGVLVSGLGLATASLLAEQPAGNAPPAEPQVDAPAGVPGAEMRETLPPVVPGAEDGVMSDGPSLAPPPEVEGPSAPSTTAPAADTTPPVEPEIGNVEGALSMPDTPEEVAMAAQPDMPVLPNPQAAAPRVPDSEADITLSTAPAPEPQETQVLVVEEPEDTPVQAPGAATDADMVRPEAENVDPAPAEQVAAPDTAPGNAPTDAVAVAPGTAPADAPTDGPLDAGDTGRAAAPASDPVPPEEAPADTVVADPGTDAGQPDGVAEAEPEPPVETPEPVLVEILPEPDARQPEGVARADNDLQPADAPARLDVQGTGSTPLTDQAPGVTVLRPGDAPDAEAAAEAEAQRRPALEAFAVSVEAQDARPLMAVVLVDEGRLPGAELAIAELPFPVTVAIDPDRPGAAEAMAAYRAAGVEVAALARVPSGALPSDVDVAFEAAFTTLPETVALVDLGTAGLQATPAVTEQAMALLAESGRGYVSVSAELSMAGRVADRIGVPMASIYRDIDGEGQDADAVRRFIDQAAFRARQSSGVVVIGRVRPDTISALSLWATANRAGQVALVPVSAVLQAQP